MEQKFRLGDEVEVSFIGKVIEARVKTIGIMSGSPVEKLAYSVESETAKAISIEESHIAPVVTPEDTPGETEG